MSYERVAAGGLGWSELNSLNPLSSSWPRTRFICGGTPTGARASRQICFIDNDPLEQATAQRAGCTQSHKPWFASSTVTECRTDPGNNPGHIWCCPEGAPRPVPTTADQRARATELIVAEQQAQAGGRLPDTTAATDPAKAPPIEPGQTEPISQQVTATAMLTKLQQNPAWVVAVLALGAGGYLAFRYFTRPKVRSPRRTTALARVR